MRTLYMTILAATAVFAGCATNCACKTECIGEPPAAGPEKEPLKVAVYADLGPSGIGAAEWYRIVNDSPDMTLKLIDGAGVRAGGLAGQDLFIMPGGSSSNEYTSLGLDGIARMKDFIRDGGGYIGTCAGCCLLMDGPRRARVMPWNTLGSEPDLFYPQVKINEAGAKALGLKAGNHKMRYHGGPLMRATTNVIEGASFELWGTVDSECTYRGRVNKAKRMHGAAAILGGTYGRGRVFVTSMHPEYYEAMHYIVVAAIRYVTGREVKIPRPQRRRGDLSVGYIMGSAKSVRNVQDMLDMAAVEGVDFQVLNGDDAFIDRFAHIDVLVAPAGIAKGKKSAALRKAAENFVSRGGTLLTCSADATPPGGIVCRNAEEIKVRVEKLAHACIVQ